MPNNFMFYLVFTSQILLLSYHFPKVILRRFNSVLKKYPPDEYPKLYVKSADYYKLGATIYKILNLFILMIGLLFILAIGYDDFYSDGNIESGFAAIYFFIQMVPMFLMEMSSFSYFKQMRNANPVSTRTAEFKQRHLFDFVSRELVAITILTNLSCIAFFAYLEPLELNFESDFLVILIALILSNCLYVVIIRFNINGKKLDPHQDATDRVRQTKNTVRTLLNISIIASLFLIVNGAIEHFSLDSWSAIIMSLYLQLIAWLSTGNALKTIRVEDINFNVYKNNGTVEELSKTASVNTVL